MYHGVDFSGAAKPADDIWLASATPTTDGLRVEACRSAATAFDASGRDRSVVLASLRDWLADADGPVGLDVSFGLPRPLLPAVDDWRAFLDWFADAFVGKDAREMQTALKERARESAADGVELKRVTDRPTGASSPYSFITRYQTLHGIRDVLAPLVRERGVAVAPMATGDDPLCEIYPASTLRALGLPDEKYKGGTHEGERARRATIVDGLREWGVELDDATATTLVEEGGGDALDAVVGTVAVARAVEREFDTNPDRYDPLEGYIYV